MKRDRIFVLVRLTMALFALATAVGVLILPSAPSGANTCNPYGCIGLQVKVLSHMTFVENAAKWPPVIGQPDTLSFSGALQEDITSGKVSYTLTGPNGVTSETYPICGATPSGSQPIPSFDPNLIAVPFFLIPSFFPEDASCPIMANTVPPTKVPFTIPSTVQPGSYDLSVVVTDQTGAVILSTELPMDLQVPTTTTLSSSANPSVEGQPVTYTATVAPVSPFTGTPTAGTVTFADYAENIPGCTNVALDSSGSATCTISGFPAGLSPSTGDIYAIYNGDDPRFAHSDSDPLIQTIVGCAAGQTSYLFTATTKTPSTIYGLFCVTKTGQATYQQGAASGSGVVNINGSSNNFIALGPNVNLGGGTSGPTSQFTEVQPLKATGTYTLTKES